jgi:thioredoxin
LTVPDGLETFSSAVWDAFVLRSKVPVVVAFWAEWNVPCRMAAPALADAARKLAGRLRVGVVDFDREPALAERYDVRGLPTVLVFKGGEECVRRVGLMGRAELRRMLDACWSI